MYGTLASRSRLLGHLHQRQHALLHPGAARRAEHDRGPPARDRALELARDLLADHRAHRAAHELEREEPGLDRDPADRGGAGAVGVARADLAQRALHLVDVLLAIDPEAQRIAALELAVMLLPLALIDDQLDAALGRHPEVVLAVRADPEVGVEVGLVERGAAPLTLGPNPLGDGLFRLRGEPLRT
jgi:hypothetical protein